MLTVRHCQQSMRNNIWQRSLFKSVKCVTYFKGCNLINSSSITWWYNISTATFFIILTENTTGWTAKNSKPCVLGDALSARNYAYAFITTAYVKILTLKNSINLVFTHLIYLTFTGKLFPNCIHTCEIYCHWGTHCLIFINYFLNASWADNTIQTQT